MTVLKKYICVLIAFLTVLMAFSGCGWEVEIVDPTEETQKTENSESEISVSELEETPENDSSPWYRNLSEHWQTDERLEKINIGGHEFKNGTCSVCKTEMEDLGDSIVLSDYSKDSNLRRRTEYDPDGKIINEINFEYDNEGRLVNRLEHEYYYSESGILTGSKLFQRDILLFEYEYAAAKDGSVYKKKETCYDEENGNAVIEYDELGNSISYVAFDKSGELLQDCKFEYALDSRGNYYVARETTFDYGRNEKKIYEYDEHFQYTLMLTEALDGSYRYEDVYENEYDEKGNMIFMRRFQDGRLLEETYFRGSEEGYVIERYITYGKDGFCRVFEYDIHGNETEVTCYKDGEKGIEVAFGEYSSERIFKNGLNSFSGFGLEWKINDISVSVETGTESKYYDVYEWYWEEFPYSEEEWNSMFIEGEIFSLEGYENIMYQSLGADVFLLYADGELWFVQLFPNNVTNGYYVWSIDKLVPEE